jgi:hypothetical protein
MFLDTERLAGFEIVPIRVSEWRSSGRPQVKVTRLKPEVLAASDFRWGCIPVFGERLELNH